MTASHRPLLLAFCLALIGAPLAAQSEPRLGLPALPPLTADSPSDSLLYADRVAVGQDTTGYPSYSATITSGFIPATTTGTGFPEIFKYQIPDGYDANGAPHPMVVAYHGFGASSGSPANQSTIDEECNARNWIYVAPTGIDDKLFGSPISQQNTEAVIQWMVDTFNVDPDRLYIVGFSMGGGVASNFAARRVDPAGLMFAGLGMVSATFDWVLEYNEGFPELHDWLTNPYNFGVAPSTAIFPYQQASSAYFDEATYPPHPGTIVGGKSMITNLSDVPTYITFDTGDVLPRVPLINGQLEAFLDSAGHTVQMKIHTGTVNPSDGLPAPHSWAVLDEVELFDFFEGLVVDRHPAAFHAQLDLAGPVSWVDTSAVAANSFSYVDGVADDGASTVQIDSVVNVLELQMDAGLAGITAMPRVTATSADARGFRLVLRGFMDSPSYLLDATSGDLIPGVDSDPLTSALTVNVPPFSSLAFDVIHDPDWSATLISDPNPASLGGSTLVQIDGPVGSTTAWVIVAAAESLIGVKGVKIAALPIPPAVLLPVPLDASGDVSFSANIPNDPGLSGLRLPTQAVLVDGTNTPIAVTNLWGFRID